MKPIILITLIATSLSVNNLQAQIRGRVLDDQNLPLANTSIRLVKPDLITTSDRKGEFTLPAVKIADTLVISHTGFQTQSVPIDTGDVNMLTILMKRIAVELEEVVLQTGYEKLPRERVTGSFAFANNQLLNEQTGSFILKRIENVLPGVYYNGKVGEKGYQVRGTSTILASGKPLVILDNFPYEGSVDNMNPNDIENITVLKDAAAASIWGARAANGVIVITTKKAKQHQPLRIELTSNFLFTKEPDLHYNPNMSSSDFIDVEQFLFSKQYRFSDTASVSRPSFSPVYEILFRLRKGQITQQQADAQHDQHDQEQGQRGFPRQRPERDHHLLPIGDGEDRADQRQRHPYQSSQPFPHMPIPLPRQRNQARLLIHCEKR